MDDYKRLFYNHRRTLKVPFLLLIIVFIITFIINIIIIFVVFLLLTGLEQRRHVGQSGAEREIGVQEFQVVLG